ncbi:carbon-nitrogen hydrolase family protein [bacterium]|nr:carbon-nitrogen hydrolase family protein [bacterium]
MKLVIATCQFATSDDIGENARRIGLLMERAAAAGAAVAHFPEACLSGYAGVDRESHADLDEDRLRTAARELARHAGRLGLWLLLGSAHPLTPPRKPHNSLYVIDAQGRLVDRYDKRFCAGPADGSGGDLAHYTPGDRACEFTIGGLRCAALICHDYRYPELVRDACRRGVQVIFHSFHAAGIPPERLARMEAAVEERHHGLNTATTYPGITMPAAMIAAAAGGHVWISCPNSAAPQSCWGSFFVRADGVVTGRLQRHVDDVLISTVDTAADLYDSTAAWRPRALAGRLHSGELVEDPRSRARTEF